MKKNKFIIITTINSPNEAIRKYSEWKDWSLVVVGDRKTPKDWSFPNLTYLDIESQYQEFGDFSRKIPENTYTRKMIGYLYAIRNGAELIFETDDDNLPYADAVTKIDMNCRAPGRDSLQRLRAENGWLNIYSRFGARNCWPRGFPLEHFKNPESLGKVGIDSKPWGVIQFLADEDPDVDAVYRMLDGTPIYFARDCDYILDAGTFCPVNSQATLWTPETFPLLFLPLGVPDRVTDILRGYIALACLWKSGKSIAYSSPVVYQKRNVHNLFKDFQQEMLIYSHADEWSKLLLGIEGGSPAQLYYAAIKKLSETGALPAQNIQAYKLFLQSANIALGDCVAL